MERLRTQGQTAVHLSVRTVFYQYALVVAIHRVLVCPSALAAFQHDGIVVHVHVATADQYIRTRIDVNGIRRGCSLRRVLFPNMLRRGIDIAVEIANMMTLIDMIRPEGRVHQMHILNGHVFRIGNIGQSRTLAVLICTSRIPLSALPEVLPITQPIAVYRAVSRNGESVNTVSIHQRREIFACLAFNTGQHHGKISNTVTALQPADYMQMRTLFKKECPRKESPLWNHYHTPTLISAAVDDALNSSRLHQRTVTSHTIIGDDVWTPQLFNIYFLLFAEPCVHLCTIGPFVGFRTHCHHQQHEG